MDDQSERDGDASEWGDIDSGHGRFELRGLLGAVLLGAGMVWVIVKAATGN